MRPVEKKIPLPKASHIKRDDYQFGDLKEVGMSRLYLMSGGYDRRVVQSAAMRYARSAKWTFVTRTVSDNTGIIGLRVWRSK